MLGISQSGHQHALEHALKYHQHALKEQQHTIEQLHRRLPTILEDLLEVVQQHPDRTKPVAKVIPTRKRRASPPPNRNMRSRPALMSRTHMPGLVNDKSFNGTHDAYGCALVLRSMTHAVSDPYPRTHTGESKTWDYETHF